MEKYFNKHIFKHFFMNNNKIHCIRRKFVQDEIFKENCYSGMNDLLKDQICSSHVYNY